MSNRLLVTVRAVDDKKFPCLEDSAYTITGSPLSELTDWLAQMIACVPPEFVQVARCAVIEGDDYPRSPTLIIEYERPETDYEMVTRLNKERAAAEDMALRKQITMEQKEARERATYNRLKAKYEP